MLYFSLFSWKYSYSCSQRAGEDIQFQCDSWNLGCNGDIALLGKNETVIFPWLHFYF